ncbi:NAD(P)-dependent oxidoreductase [Cypionkella sp.]|uniref:NAD(P)-dependent oxidoreductase n=1 Tax=Cypionkella sp. TaxID=2811411 RepID=UPI00271A1AC3|nr:NAD(P)-dependent oxidoreductase [Cypionkella sp.]MDO8984721.1 NAD(P)-dependent oxidoreductase [Cypionkella sp.]MDP1577825.1 NAD(P)-dependent oxidoreductase [Cypionkella sp.]MDP2050805.1 NAD(P)-dependent oxidoreductase [Cypionkella sp.]
MNKDVAEISRLGVAGMGIGWIGAGKMGAPMIRNLLAAGARLSVSEPDDDARDDLVRAGATAAENLSAHSSNSIVFATLPNDKVLRDVVLGAAGLAQHMAAGSVLVEMSTVSPECSAEVAYALKDKRIFYLRAPLSGSTAMAETATLTVLASGDQQGWDTAIPAIRLLSSRQFYLGQAEEARYMKLVINTLVGATSAILAEAIALGASGGLSPASMMEVICESAVASPLLKYKAAAVVAQDYAPAFSVQQMIKDFSLISDAGRANGVPLLTTGLILELYRAAANSGLRDQDFFALVKWQSEISA